MVSIIAQFTDSNTHSRCKAHRPFFLLSVFGEKGGCGPETYIRRFSVVKVMGGGGGGGN